MRPCPSCAAPNDDGARFCSQCATPLVGETGEERKLVTILFADITGSTGLGQRFDPETLKEITGAYFRAMQEEIEAEGGTVEKFIGDAVMAAFGVPSAHEDDPARALRAALRMRRRLNELNESLAKRHDVTLAMRIGVNTGEVMASTTPGQTVGMVSGDAVNVAARLEQAAEPGQIVASERTARATRGFDFGPAKDIDIRGRDEGVSAMEVLGSETEQPVQERGIPGLRAPMVGRDRELDLLQSVYRRVAEESRPSLVTIYGDPGIGKSRLVREFTAWAAARMPPPMMVSGRCLPYGEGVTYWPLAEILKARAGVLDNDSAEAALEKINKLARDALVGVTDVDRSAAVLAFAIGLEDPRFDIASAAPRQVRIETHDAWRSLFAGLAVSEPLVVVIEDIHWADGALLDLLEELAERTPGAVLFVCPARHELTQRRPGWGGGKRNFSSIALEPLTPDDAEQLITFLLAVEDLPQAVRETILARAEGNPFFLEEIIRQLIDEGRIVHADDRWRAAAEISDAVIPDTVQGVLAARIDLLEAREKRTLQSAAVVGRVFWTGPVARLLNGDADTIDETLDVLEGRELILSRLGSAVAGDREYIFKHILTRDVAYGSLPRRERGAAHARVAEWIEEAAEARTREFADLLAHHYAEAYERASVDNSEDAGRLRVKTFEYLLLAATEARSKMQLERADDVAKQALSLAANDVERAAVHESLGMTALYDYRGDDAWRWLTQAVDERVATKSMSGPDLAMLAARAVEAPMRWPGSMGDPPAREEVERYIAIGVEHAGEIRTEARVRVLLAEAFRPFAFVDFADETIARAESFGEEAIRIAEDLNRPDLLSAVLDAMTATNHARGYHGKNVEPNRRRLEVARTLIDPWEIGDAFQVAADQAVMTGDYAMALAFGDEGYRRSRSGPEVWVACLAWRAAAKFKLGDWDGVLSDYNEIESARLSHDSYWHVAARGFVAMVHELRGDNETASLILEALERETGWRQWSRAGGNIARLMARRGRIDDAFAVLHSELISEIGKGNILEAECDIVAMSGRWDDADEVVARARARAEEAELKALPFHADRLEGHAALAGGDVTGAIAGLARAERGFAVLGARWEAAYSALSLGEAMLASGDTDGARATLERAREVFDALGSVLEQRRAREMLARA